MCSSPPVRSCASLRGTPRFTAIALPVNLIGLAALVALGVSSLGCGKKGDPMPAPRTIPQAATDLKVRQRGLEVVAEFAYPKSTVAGLPLPAVDEVTLFVLERPLASTAPAAGPTPATPAAPATSPIPGGALAMPDRREFALAAKPFLALSGAELASAISGDRISVRFRLPEPLAADLPARIFAVRTHAAGGELSDWSNLAGLLPRLPPPPPMEFSAAATRNGIELGWRAGVATSAGGAGASTGYNLYRRDAARTSYGEPIATLDAAASATVDGGVTYGRRYIYALTAIATREPLAESALSVEREIDYQDRFAPLPPVELSALGSVGEVRLVWQSESRLRCRGLRHRARRPGCPVPPRELRTRCRPRVHRSRTRFRLHLPLPGGGDRPLRQPRPPRRAGRDARAVSKVFKVSGGGNDFLALAAPEREPSADEIRSWCARGLSFGADGLFTLHPTDSGDVRMRYWNSDGNSAALCINGTRCAARLALHLRLGPRRFPGRYRRGILSRHARSRRPRSRCSFRRPTSCRASASSPRKGARGKAGSSPSACRISC